ncbi:aromatic ring-hydroxylating dioxygenase subunit alpha [filamentous cyanobacterium LEGE 11480]|uniref:Aromatic ring-hydroxylating dioxygenase subunit alpha n=1 Tax=Romeriopsis navalis LEGE 11480 TaxID=2777977 RepID=A0A928VR62_9CYAN|nr:aromatic ring-hydroxylating dioxygenase subunit alpha [Romeriopsis navalis]MBE9033156.1 aromatic ring-hydroxylating dioxygenase subunit alpha [Romeriopsis navalis LEGE 11480]
MLKNFWYAVEFSQALSDQPKLVQIFGQKIALYRDTQGRVQALDNLCPHRGASLALGQVQRDSLQCPYHGWHFDPDGKCVKIPSNLPGAAIPQRAKVTTYPVQEKDGWIWLFWGDRELAESTEIPHVPDVHDAELRMVQSDFQWQVNYERAIENVLDIAHVPFVHAGAFGNPNAPEVERLTVESDAWGASARVTMAANPPRGIWRLLARRDPSPVKARTGFILPNLTVLELTISFGRLVIWTAQVPIDDYTTVSKSMSFRSFFRGKWADSDAIKRSQRILEQDRPVVESQFPQQLPELADAEIHVAADALQLKYREYRDALRVAGGDHLTQNMG